MNFTVAIVAIVLGYTWVIGPMAPAWVSVIAGALVIVLGLSHAVRTGEWGLEPAAFVPALWQSLLFTAAATFAVYIAGVSLGTWHHRHDGLTSIALLIAWGLGQQFALHTVFLHETRKVVGSNGGIVLAAALFAALHLPNPFLTAMTFVGALVWCWIYARHPNLLPMSLSHAALTLAILYAFDEATTGHLRVGAAYLSLR